MEYKASTDLRVKLTTVFVALLFAFLIYNQVQHNSQLRLITAIILGIAFVGSFCLSTLKYTINENSLVIVTPLYNKTIRKKDIFRVDLVNRKDLGFMIRLFGNGGLFGYYGWYRAANLGKFFFYGTQMKNLILIQMNTGSKYMITPDDTSILSELQPSNLP